MKKIIFSCLLFVVVLFVGCSKPDVRGIINEENIVTFQEVRENPDKYLYKSISFYAWAPDAWNRGYGVEDGNKCKRLYVRHPEKKASTTKTYLKKAKEGIAIEDADIGLWEVYVDCDLPPRLFNMNLDSLEGIGIFKPEEYREDGELPFIEGEENILYTGILFNVGVGSPNQEHIEEYYKLTGKKIYSTISKVYLTGIKIPK